jgi:hypothetical protein
MNNSDTSDVQAFVQTSAQSGRFVWTISLVDFGARKLKRTMVSDDTFTTADAARVAGEAQLKAMAADH